MKQSLNHANHFAMLLMALAIAFTFLACEEKDKKADSGGGEAKAEQEEAQQSAFDGSIAAKVENGNSLNSAIKDLWIFSVKGDKFPVTGSYGSGGFAITLPEKPNEKYMHSVNKLFYNTNKISDRSANIFSFSEIHGMGKNGSLNAIFKQEKQELITESSGYGHLEKVYVSFYYSDRDVIIQLKERDKDNGNANLNLNLKTGWNKVYTRINMNNGNFSQTTAPHAQEFEWRLLYETKGNIDIKLPEADSDQLSHVALCVSENYPLSLYGWSSNIDDVSDILDKLGYGKSFKLFSSQASSLREKDLDGWLQSFTKLVAPLIPHEKYVDKDWDRTVRRLLTAYGDLAASPGSFREIYDIMSSRYGYYAYDEILTYVRDKRLEDFLYGGEGEVDKWAVFSAYSFWGRRYNENPKNVEPIAASLRLFRDGVLAADAAKKKYSFKTVKIGSKTWMAENLNIKTGMSWCYGKNESNCKKYGRLYDWTTAKWACPSGWHLPSFEEWEELIEAIGKDNDSEFSATPGGARHPERGFMSIDSIGTWWSATEKEEGDISARYFWIKLASGSEDIRENNDEKNFGMSVRCVKD